MARTVSFTTVGWTDTGQGWQQERDSTENVPDRLWAVARDHLQFVPQPPESLQDLTGIPIWSLASVRVGTADQWCFTVQGRGAGHRAGTVQFAFADGRHPASTVWRAAATLVATPGHGSSPDRLPWSRSSVDVPAVAGAVPVDAAAFEKAAAELLTALLGPSGMTIVQAGPELMAGVLPAVLAIVPAGLARALRWHTCLLQPAKSVRATQNAVVGEWSPHMRRLAGPAASEADAWLENMRRQQRRFDPGPDTNDLVTQVARGLAQGHAVDPEETADAGSVRGALDRAWTAWQRPALDVPALVNERQWARLLAAPDGVHQYAAATPRAAADLLRGGSAALDRGVAVLLFRGLAGQLPSDSTIADALGLPAEDGSGPSDAYLTWLGAVVRQSLDETENWALIRAFTAPGGRWHGQAARLAGAPLFTAMGYTRASCPDLYPFDAAGLAARIVQRDEVSDDVRQVIETSGDPLGVVRSVTGHLSVPSPRLFGGLLACALAVRDRPADWDEQLYALGKDWVDDQASTWSSHQRSDWPTPPQWWARMVSFADRSGADRGRAAADRTLLVDAGLAGLFGNGYSEREVLVAVSDAPSTTLETHLSELDGRSPLTPSTAAFIGQLVPLWRDEQRELVVAQQELAATRSKLGAARREAQAAAGRARAEFGETGSRYSEGGGEDSDADERPRTSRFSSFLEPLRPKGDGDDLTSPRNVAGTATMIGVLAFVVVVVVAVTWWAVGGRKETPAAPTAQRTAPAPAPTVPTAGEAAYDGSTVTLTVSGVTSGSSRLIVLLAQYDPNAPDKALSVITATVVRRSGETARYTAFGTFPPHQLSAAIGPLPVHVWVLDPALRKDRADDVLAARKAVRDDPGHDPSPLIEAANRAGTPTTTVKV
ncbi:hypothetical protein [Cryptosporangium sp. NPDC051539]|uniref:hypothetical protein n=1 Tax=Cryptosporangium sp. NPDC051539 TaxID=3363962 RepID=UPI0037A796E7